MAWGTAFSAALGFAVGFRLHGTAAEALLAFGLCLVVPVAGSSADWTAAGLAVRKFFDRHKGKRIRVDETGLAEAENYSARDIELIVRALSAPRQGANSERP